MQVNENINASNFLVVSTQTSKSNVKDDNTSQLDFASFLAPAADNQMKRTTNVQQSGNNKTVKTASEDNASVSNISDATSEKMQKTEQNTANNAVGNTETKSENQDVSLKDNADNLEALEDGSFMTEMNAEISTEDADAILEVLGNILQQLTKQFDLNVDDIYAKLDELGMETTDLLSEEGLKTFFLSMNDAEISDLITSESLNQEWNQLLNDVTEVIEQSEMGWDDITRLVEEENVVELLKKPVQTGEKEFLNYLIDESLDKKDDTVSVSGEEEPVVVISDEREPLFKANQSLTGSGENQNTNYSDKTEKHSEKEMKATTTESSEFKNPFLQTIEQAIDHVENIQNVSEATVSGREIVEQIVEQIRVNMNQDSTSLEMQLYPEHLGKIQINVVSKDGVMTARIVAETEAAKQAIEGGLTNLKESLESQNLKVDAIEVMVSTAGFEKGNEEQDSYKQQQSSRSGKKIDLSELLEDTDESETAELEKMKYSGSSVSYTA